MKKQILIIGGGISGLTVLHYLKKRYAGNLDVQIQLLEKNETAGGTIKTIREDGFIFEAGPNGFLSSRAETTFELIDDLGLQGSLISANQDSKIRFISVKNTLYRIPKNPLDFFSFELLSWRDKLRIPCEVLVPKGKNPDESVYDFGRRRLCENFSKIFLDCVVSGIYGGDAHRLSLKAAFPRIYEIEQTYGSLFKGMLHLGLTQKRNRGEKKFNAQPKGTLTSFRGGMTELTEKLAATYADSIQTNAEVFSMTKEQRQFFVKTSRQSCYADEIFLCTPAYQAAEITKEINASLGSLFLRIDYVPLAVVGLGFRKSTFKTLPAGFGYLTPSSQKRNILGVLFDSNIYLQRSSEDCFLLRVMMGGARGPDIIEKPIEELIAIARSEIRSVFKIFDIPVFIKTVFWPKAIPQYNIGYLEIKEKIEQELAKINGLHLAANYLGGVSLNDCIRNAKLCVSKCGI